MSILKWEHSVFRIEETMDSQTHKHAGQRYCTDIFVLEDTLAVRAEITADYVDDQPLSVTGRVTVNDSPIYEKHFHEVGEAQRAIACMVDKATFPGRSSI